MTDDNEETGYANNARYVEEVADIKYANEPRNKLQTGDELNLTRKDPAINQIMVGVGWDIRGFDNDPPDLDASIFLLDKDGRTRVDSDFIFYNSLTGCDGAVKHMGDNRTGAGEGDDESVMIELNSLPFDVAKISFVLSIYDLDLTDHNFSMVKNVYFRVVNQGVEHEMFRYELDEELTGNEGLLIGELERVGTDWVFHAIGKTVEGGLSKIADEYGIVVQENMM